jgi:hypothetical protein
VIWNRWLAQAATMLVWALLLLPLAAGASLGSPERGAVFWLGVVGVFLLSLVLTELGLRFRDPYQRYLRRRFDKRS